MFYAHIRTGGRARPHTRGLPPMFIQVDGIIQLFTYSKVQLYCGTACTAVRLYCWIGRGVTARRDSCPEDMQLFWCSWGLGAENPVPWDRG